MTQLLNNFISIRFGLLIEISNSIPGDNKDNIQLENVIVSKLTIIFKKVVQFDKEKIYLNKQFEQTRTLKKCFIVFITNVQRLET
jgi:hypothetical protein